jgi:predicted Zn finger-like uncharacterized protein
MITQCSHCNTKFEISKELVESQDPRVRCGECLNVFNARLQLVVEEEFSEPQVPTVTRKVRHSEAQQQQKSPAVALESYVSGEDLENAATIVLDDHPATPAGDSNVKVNDGFYSPDLDYGKVPSGSPLDSTTLEFERTLALDSGSADKPAAELPQSTAEQIIDNDLTAPQQTADAAAPDVALQQPPLSDAKLDQESVTRDHTGNHNSAGADTAMYESESAVALRDHVTKRGGDVVPLSSAAETTRRSSQQKSMLVPLLCCAVALMGVLYVARDQVAKLDLPEPVLSAFCSVTGCELEAAKDLSRLDLLGHRMNSHPTLSDVLVINVELINRAPFPQPYPVLSVTMSDSEGETVATRKFQPADYLEPEALNDTLPGDELVRISFEILDPGPEASSSVLVFE